MSSYNEYESCYEDYSTTDSDSTSKIGIDSAVSPLKLQWSFGFNAGVPVINLDNKSRSLVAYACSHVTMLYDYKARKMFPLQGHRGYVRTLCIDQTGKWLLSADFEEDSTIVIWDTESRIPICTLFNTHGKYGLTAASLSPNAKYIVTIGNENVQVVKLWLWTLGREVPDATAELTEISGERIKEISFDYHSSDLIALSTDQHVIFILWNQQQKKLDISYPAIIPKKSHNLGTLNNTTFVSATTKVFTATVNGYVVVWDVLTDDSGEKKVEYIKSVYLQKINITRIMNYKGMVVTGNVRGEINFYDTELKILYWCRNCGLDSITSISFEPPFEFPIESFVGKTSIEKDSLLSKDKCAIQDSEESVEIPERVNEIPSNVTGKIEYTPKPLVDKKSVVLQEKFEKFQVPRDATLESNKFCIDKFIASSTTGQLAWVDVSTLKCRLISNYSESPLTAVDTHPKNEYAVFANKTRELFLFNYKNFQVLVKNNIPDLPDITLILKNELSDKKINHISNTEMNQNENSYATALKFSPTGDILMCATSNGVIWIIHPDTLEPLDPLPFKHSNEAILEIAFSEDSRYIAYYDDNMTVMVLKLSDDFTYKCYHCYHFVGKYRSHNLPIRGILFGTPLSHQRKSFPRLLSLGEDQDLIEYDLSNSGPYPNPGLVILQINRIEQKEIPLSMAWYPKFGVEHFLVTSNSDFKFKLYDAATKQTRFTILGPTFTSPVKKMMVCPITENEKSAYMIFASDKEIGLQLLPFDGNPYKILGFIGHPQKIAWMRISNCRGILFTLGLEDQCALIWKINFKSVDIMQRLGGKGLTPFYGLINGGKEGWLLNEMQDIFVYGQILQEGENCMKERHISDEISIEQIPNLMRAIGFYPSHYQLENMIYEVSYKNYASTGELKKKINFEEFVKLYINHRPTYGVTMKELKNAFSTLANQENRDDSTLTKQQFIDILCGETKNTLENSEQNYDTNDIFSLKEAETYLKNLTLKDSSPEKAPDKHKVEKTDQTFGVLPNHISYKDFATNIMGIESPKETRADNSEK